MYFAFAKAVSTRTLVILQLEPCEQECCVILRPVTSFSIANFCLNTRLTASQAPGQLVLYFFH